MIRLVPESMLTTICGAGSAQACGWCPSVVVDGIAGVGGWPHALRPVKLPWDPQPLMPPPDPVPRNPILAS